MCSCVPGMWTPEAGLIAVQGCLLVWRTWLTDYISRIEARAGRHLIAQVALPTYHELCRFQTDGGSTSLTPQWTTDDAHS